MQQLRMAPSTALESSGESGQAGVVCMSDERRCSGVLSLYVPWLRLASETARCLDTGRDFGGHRPTRGKGFWSRGGVKRSGVSCCSIIFWWLTLSQRVRVLGMRLVHPKLDE